MCNESSLGTVSEYRHSQHDLVTPEVTPDGDTNKKSDLKIEGSIEPSSSRHDSTLEHIALNDLEECMPGSDESPYCV